MRFQPEDVQSSQRSKNRNQEHFAILQETLLQRRRVGLGLLFPMSLLTHPEAPARALRRVVESGAAPVAAPPAMMNLRK